MKAKYIILSCLLLSLLGSCKNAEPFQDAIYFTGTEKSATTRFAIDGPTSMGISVSASDKVQKDMNIQLKASPELLEAYNQQNNKKYKVLPAGSYDLSKEAVVIENGQSVSDQVRVSINSIDALEEGVTYCLPVSIVGTDGNMKVLESSRTMYMVFDRTIITYAATLGNAYFNVPFSEHPELNAVPNLSMETRIYVNEFQARSPFITSVMGIEENFLLRFGDVNIHKEQLQLAGGGYPLTSTIDFSAKKWYHVAIVYDGSKLKLYIDGVLNGTTDAPRGNIDLTDTFSGGFHIGFSAGGRKLNGVISEARVWTKALTEADVVNNMCYVDPTSEGLLAYWRFNEGKGNDIKDWTGHGYDITASGGDISWVEGVRCPE